MGGGLTSPQILVPSTCLSHPARSKSRKASKRTQQHKQVKNCYNPPPPPRRVADVAPWWAGLKESLEIPSGPSALFEKLYGNRPSRNCSAPGQKGPLFRMPLRRLLAAAPLCSALLIAVAPWGAMANAPKTVTGQAYAVAQVASIEDFNDNLPISPDHWAYGRLSELVERNCVAGFPDKTFRGDQRATRYEVAALLESCLASASLEPDPKPPPTNEENQNIFVPTLILLIGITSFIVYQFFLLRRIKNLGKDVEKILEISQERRPELQNRIGIISGVLTIVSVPLSFFGFLWQIQQQKSVPTTPPQETAPRETTGSLSMGHNPDHLPAKHNTLAVSLHLPESASANCQGLLAHGPAASPLGQIHQKPESPRILQT